MKKPRRFSLSRPSSGEAGQALILVLIFLMLGSLTLVPTLTHISTALKTGEVYEKNTDELYTADAGIEDSLWRIKYDFMGADYNPYDFETAWPYQTEDLNGMTANFTISNVWFPTNVNLVDPYAPGFIDLTPAEVREMMESEKLIVAGSADFSDNISPYRYKIKLDFNPAPTDNLTIKSFGIWLPRDFNYSANSCSLWVEGAAYKPDQPEVRSEAPGGSTVLWTYNPPHYPRFVDFPNFNQEDMTFEFYIEYTTPLEGRWPSAVAWVTTQLNDLSGNPKYPLNTPEHVPVSWDIDTRYFKIVSAAGDTEIQAYSSKNELRQMGDAMSGDYVAIGNSLLSDDDGDDKRDDWHYNPFNLNTIPSDADAVYAYLYWSGWRNEGAIQDISPFPDSCSSFNNWLTSNDDIKNQTQVPTNDGDANGTWSYNPNPPANYWDQVNDTSPNDNDYIKATATYSGSAYRLFTFPQFSIPTNATIQNVTIYVRAMQVSSGTDNIRAALKIKGGSNPYYSWASSTQPTTSWTTYSYTCNNNPKTGSAWTPTDLNNNSSTNALQQFGVYSTDVSPNIQVSMVYARVNYYIPSLWTLNSGEFRGLGYGSTTTEPRTLTLENSENLSSYATKTIGVSWEESTSGNLETGDAMYFAFSGDGGAHWSDDIEAFHDDVENDRNKDYKLFCYSVPQDYVTGSFKMRFYLNINGTDEYVKIDNIRICYLTPDTSITFKIGNDQVYFDGSEPAVGLHPLTAGRSYAMLNTMWGDPYGFSYACVRDVSALVKKYPIHEGEEHHTGNASYYVEAVTADTRNPDNSLSDFAFAGWSLIVVYARPESAGHYIYIRDDNFAFHPGTGGNLDFDGDGSPGGTITGFKIPDPIMTEQGGYKYPVAARLTCFVVEGDDFTSDSSNITVTGPTGHYKKLTNLTCEPNDVWNGRSYPGDFTEGVDIDTFELNWNDDVLAPGDRQLQVDMYSLNDAWNLVYFIISIQSETVTSGTPNYLIRGG
jgi:hypothetical protein